MSVLGVIYNTKVPLSLRDNFIVQLYPLGCDVIHG